MIRHRLAAAFAILGALTLAACAGPSTSSTTSGPSPRATVEIVDFTFVPAEITVAAGTTVEWVNREKAVPHTTTSVDGVWDSGTLQPGDTFRFTFDEPGTYPYLCTIHPYMKGTVVVTP